MCSITTNSSEHESRNIFENNERNVSNNSNQVENRSRSESLVIIKRLGCGALESKLCFFCNKIQSNHYCLAEVSNSNTAIICDGKNKHICGKNSCFLCRSNWGNAEDF